MAHCRGDVCELCDLLAKSLQSMRFLSPSEQNYSSFKCVATLTPHVIFSLSFEGEVG